MEIALYCPETGYYEAGKDNVGRGGDFMTSVSAGGLFGELLAFQFAEWLMELRIADCGLRIVEAGAHDGRLAADILHWLRQHRPELFSQIEYLILEPSATRRAWQQKMLADFPNVRWRPSFREINAAARPPRSGDAPSPKGGGDASAPKGGSDASAPVHGIIFSNELLDAFPVRRFGWDAKTRQWFEWGVALADEKFVWRQIPISQLPDAIPQTPSPRPETPNPRPHPPSPSPQLPSSLLKVLPDGYILEDSPAAESWWREAAAHLARGKLLAIDYGFADGEQISPARLRGTLRAYHRHQVSDDLLARPGEQDLTAHVNFPALQQAGEAAGLTTETFASQPQFLTRIFSRAVKAGLFARLDAKQVRQFQTLTHPEHLGRAFRVLVQGR